MAHDEVEPTVETNINIPIRRSQQLTKCLVVRNHEAKSCLQRWNHFHCEMFYYIICSDSRDVIGLTADSQVSVSYHRSPNWLELSIKKCSAVLQLLAACYSQYQQYPHLKVFDD